MANSFGKGQGEHQSGSPPEPQIHLARAVSTDLASQPASVGTSVVLPPIWSIEADRSGWRSKVLLNGELFPCVSEVTLRISAKGTTELTLVLLPKAVKVTPIDGTIYFEVGDRRFRVEELAQE